MIMIGQSQSQTLRDAAKLIAHHAQARRVPRVLWLGLTESAEAFALRCARLQLNGVDRILAAVPFGFKVPDGVQRVEFAPKIFKLFHPSTPSRYRAAPGGRGSGKSHGVATVVVLLMLTERMRVLCAREMMNSLSESVHHLLEAKIEALGLAEFFDITNHSIVCVTSGSEIIFKGLYQNASGLKSLESIKLCWLEQSEAVSKDSMEILKPTIRDPDSEIWMTLNPSDPGAPAQEYADGKKADTLRDHFTYLDNPWWNSVLEGERVDMQRTDHDLYAHTYLGECRFASEACVFAGKYVIEAFEPDLSIKPNDATKDKLAALGRWEDAHRIDRAEKEQTWQGPMQGADWGFSQDPTVLIRCWTFQRVLYIEYEAYAVGCDIDKTPALFDQIPDARKYVTRGDCARPETISFMQQHGYPKVTAAKKWPNCAEDGVAFMRSFERIVIHPRCVKTAEEFRLFSHKIVKLTGDILPDLEDKNNHTIDALRYALERAIRGRGGGRFIPMGADHFRFTA
jgi:phage terminase large subunit